MNKILIALLTFILTAGLVLACDSNNKPDKNTICHNGDKIVIDWDYPNEHFNLDGTPKEGHETDLLFESEVDCPTPVPPSGGCILPATPTELFVDSGILNDQKITLTWSSEAGTVEIKYGWDENNLDQIMITENDGETEIGGLTNGVHYWFQIFAVNICGSSEGSAKVDPLP